MFIESTARHFGMRVDSSHDDRLNPDVETDAAMRYLAMSYLQFQDWFLALMAYNAGEHKVEEGIEETGSRDVWKLIDAGFDGDKNYIAMVVATIIIMKNPQVIT
jgi:membrane-bound lytic murein transglycosylase D